jgi:hypothetical protein
MGVVTEGPSLMVQSYLGRLTHFSTTACVHKCTITEVDHLSVELHA